MGKPFRVSVDYIAWAHESAADDGQPLALKLFEQPRKGDAFLIDCPQLVAEIADVAQLYVGGDDNVLRAARVRTRAVDWLKERGLTVKQALVAECAA